MIESDLWQQYNELGGVNGGNAAYMAALSNLDGDMPQYIADNTDDELSHAAFLNAYLSSKGAQPVNLDEFRTLPSSQATGARQIGRLTNLTALDVDTSWYVRYRSTENPDLGATFPQAVNDPARAGDPAQRHGHAAGAPAPVPPVGDQQTRMQAIANTAGFHFAYIEQGGSSLYSIMALKATSLEVLRIIVSIGGVETNHFSLWHDKAGNAVAQPLAGVTDPETGVTFPDLNAKGGELNQTNLILPEPCTFLHQQPSGLLDRAAHARPARRRGRDDRELHRRPAVRGPVPEVLPRPSTSSPARPTPPSAGPCSAGARQPNERTQRVRCDFSAGSPDSHPGRRPAGAWPKRLPAAGRALGQGLREFKGSITGDESEEQ